MSTYVTAIIAGEYHGVFDTYDGKFGQIPLGHYCRQSLVEYLDREELVKITSQSFEFFEEQFGFPYPFEKYDQLYVPEYNMGAMENAGCVTLRDEYLPRSRQPRSFYEFRCSVITHEMAHMWFGDLVTMKWWDDLWLNESFAEWACYWAEDGYRSAPELVAEIVDVDSTVEGPSGSYGDVVVIDTTDGDGRTERAYYAEGVGLVHQETTVGVPAVVLDLIARPS